jgi:hypothetical protein
MHYILKHVSQYVGYQLAKFDPDRFEAPAEVYIIKGRSCSCPSPKFPCKHIAIVDKLKSEPISYFDDESNSVMHLPLGVED